MRTKRFDKNLYKECDKTGKELARLVFASLDPIHGQFVVVSSEEECSTDLVVDKLKDGRRTRFRVEVELCRNERNWQDRKFYYDKIHVPARKTRYVEDDEWYIQFSPDQAEFGLVRCAAINGAETEERAGRMPDGQVVDLDTYSNVPFKDWKWFKIVRSDAGVSVEQFYPRGQR